MVAYQSDKSGFVALLSYLNIVVAYLADILILDENLNTIEFLAALAILLVALGTAFYKLRMQALEKQRPEAKPLLDDDAKTPANQK